MFWRDTELSCCWYRAPIETQAMMIEAFDEVMNDAEGGRGLQGLAARSRSRRRTGRRRRPPPTRSTPCCCAATNLLASDALVEVTLGGQAIKPEKVEAGTGFYEQKFARGEIKPRDGPDHREEDSTRASPGAASTGSTWRT